MPDLLIRDFPAAELALIDAQARRLGLSRTEFLRRQLQQTARSLDAAVTKIDLVRASELACDLVDAEIMSEAWS
ncbi:hypothetical protein SAMN06309944_1784 [Micrococcales bacterium KH10]|nr:hypothetical protein SAMN06309944_1784 [Micrococcales bacterium KH10]